MKIPSIFLVFITIFFLKHQYLSASTQNDDLLSEDSLRSVFSHCTKCTYISASLVSKKWSKIAEEFWFPQDLEEMKYILTTKTNIELLHFACQSPQVRLYRLKQFIFSYNERDNGKYLFVRKGECFSTISPFYLENGERLKSEISNLYKDWGPYSKAIQLLNFIRYFRFDWNIADCNFTSEIEVVIKSMNPYKEVFIEDSVDVTLLMSTEYRKSVECKNYLRASLLEQYLYKENQENIKSNFLTKNSQLPAIFEDIKSLSKRLHDFIGKIESNELGDEDLNCPDYIMRIKIIRNLIDKEEQLFIKTFKKENEMVNLNNYFQEDFNTFHNLKCRYLELTFNLKELLFKVLNKAKSEASKDLIKKELKEILVEYCHLKKMDTTSI